MKVLHIINQLTVGGAEKLLLETLPHYNAKGLLADVLVLKATKDDFFLKQLKAQNSCNIIELPFGSVYNPLVIFKLKPYLISYDVIHAHLFPAFYFLAIAKILFKCNAKLVFTEHNTTNRRMKKWWLKPFEVLIYKQYHKIIAISNEVAAILKAYIPFKNKAIVTIENGVDISKVAQGKAKNIHPSAQNKKIITQIAAFRPQKDHATLIKSLQYLPQDYVVVLAGEGETKITCQNLAKSLNLSHRVVFFGNRPDITDIMASSDVLVLSTHYEGLSIASIEAMASGKPFVASRVAGLKDLVENTGVLFPLGNAKALADCILKLIQEDDYREKVIKACKEKAKLFDISIMIQKHIDLYHECSG